MLITRNDDVDVNDDDCDKDDIDDDNMLTVMTTTITVSFTM